MTNEAMPLRELDDDLWVAEQPQRFCGIEVGTRMTVVRQTDGGLWIHSPIEPSDALCHELKRLGTVRWIVAPNRFHHLYADAFAQAYPAARLLACPGLPDKRPDVHFDGVVAGQADAPWSDDLEVRAVEGVPIYGELLCCHRASRTLIATDLVFNIQSDSPLLTKAAMWLVGAYRRFGPGRELRLFTRDRRALRRSIDDCLEWDFDRVVMAHGHVLEEGGHDAFQRAFEWL